MQWIEHAPEVLFSSLDTLEVSESHLNQMASGPRYSGRKGLSLERWKFWATEFQTIGSRDDVSEATKSFCLNAADKMMAIASAHSGDNTAVASALGAS